MGISWIIVAHRAGARILEYNWTEKTLQLISTIEHEAGRLTNEQLESDRPGTSFSSGPGPGRHPMGHEGGAHERDAEEFAKKLGSLLDAGRNEQRFREIVLVAEPRFLGILRAKLHPHTAAMVTDTVPKDLANVPTHDLKLHLRDVVKL
jgi:protein required for attachment to host cells